MGTALEYASQELQKDRAVVIEAVEECTWALEFAHEERRQDKTVMMKAVEADGMALRFAGPRLREDKELVMKAVEQDGYAIQVFYSFIFHGRQEEFLITMMHFGCWGHVPQQQDPYMIFWVLFNCIFPADPSPILYIQTGDLTPGDPKSTGGGRALIIAGLRSSYYLSISFTGLAGA
ncbi:unnamed protein product [Amoebophrya sp. A25]|nr:unnamed protein product [Amoebophrya sp. A25]|eukprot:GSA25T00019679001.1